MSEYQRRILDDELDELFGDLPAVSIEGPKGVGKTATASARAMTSLYLDTATDWQLFDADPGRLDRSPPPVLIDEWQRHPRAWDLVRRSVDRNPVGGRFILTGSARPIAPPTHSGAGRIVRMRMRPMSLAERGLPDAPTVSLRETLAGDAPSISGNTTMDLVGYVEEIVGSGLPGVRRAQGRARQRQLDGYLDRIVDTDFEEVGHVVRRPATLRAWLAAFAAATATTTSYNTILDASTAGVDDKPAKTTTIAYREALERLWLLDSLPGWVPGLNHLSRLAQAPKHHLADPALAARLVGATAAGLLGGAEPSQLARRDGTFLGALFESLVALSVRVYAQPLDATVSHLRTQNGDHEVDLIVEGPDRRVVAIEVKMSGDVTDRDVVHLRWLKERIGDRVAGMVVVTCGPYAYRRPDGIAVVPASLLGP